MGGRSETVRNALVEVTPGNLGPSNSRPDPAPAQVFVEVWKRKQSRFAMTRGMVGFEVAETDRPEFAEDPESTLIHSPVDGLPTSYFPEAVARRRRCASGGVIGVCVCCVLCVVYSIFLLNVVLKYPSRQRHLQPSSWHGTLPDVKLRSSAGWEKADRFSPFSRGSRDLSSLQVSTPSSHSYLGTRDTLS